MPPHFFLGYSLAELWNIFLLVTGFGGWIIWLVSHFITKPLQDSIHDLSNTVKDFQMASKEEHRAFSKHFDKVDERLESHDLTLNSHNEQIKTLFHDKEDRHEK